MKLEEAIRQRRSIRHYTDRVPTRRIIDKILAAAIWAPSGLNNQPWKFKVLTGQKDRDRLAAFTKYGQTIKKAPVAICVFLDLSVSYNRQKDTMAIGACIQNMLLQAYELGLGTCWLGEILNRRQEVEKYLRVDPERELMAVITAGYPDEEMTEGCRKRLQDFMLKDP